MSDDSKRKILIADDELSIRKLYEREFDRQGYAVIVASDGKETLDKVREERPDLVILDVRMPGMDGVALASRLKEEFPDVPVVALSGNLETKDGQDHNFVGFLEKPIRIEQLQKMIEVALGQGD